MAPNPNNTYQLAGVMPIYPKRAQPSVTLSGASTFTNMWQGGSSTPSAVAFGVYSNKSVYPYITSSTNQGGYSTLLQLNAGAVTSNYVIVSAEL